MLCATRAFIWRGETQSLAQPTASVRHACRRLYVCLTLLDNRNFTLVETKDCRFCNIRSNSRVFLRQFLYARHKPVVDVDNSNPDKAYRVDYEITLRNDDIRFYVRRAEKILARYPHSGNSRNGMPESAIIHVARDFLLM